MNQLDYMNYYNDIPVGHKNRIRYEDLCAKWNVDRRGCRRILAEIEKVDNGDDFIIIRSGRDDGIYKTDGRERIANYYRERYKKATSSFGPTKKMRRILGAAGQITMLNNLRQAREDAGIKQSRVCSWLRTQGEKIDEPLLSKMENGVCLPTPRQLGLMADLYESTPDALIGEGVVNG